MAFLKLKKKPGGTMLGNVVRGYANKYSAGAVGNGKNMIPLPSSLDDGIKKLSDNQEAINQLIQEKRMQAATKDDYPVSSPPMIDLGKIIKFPTLETNNGLEPKTLAMMALGVLAVGYLLKKL